MQILHELELITRITRINCVKGNTLLYDDFFKLSKKIRVIRVIRQIGVINQKQFLP